MAKVLILCPTFDHADTLFASIGSVRAQTFADWEMAVICDGSPPRTEEVLAAITAREPRVRVYRHPKGERYGEAYRDPVIRESGAELVCHLSDDDVWASDHLVQMTSLLEHAEWANQAPLRLRPAGGVEWLPANHGTAAMRGSVVRHRPISAGLNYVAYRREAYLKLPEGWTCAPWEAGASDVYMWAKFFRLPGLSVASTAISSAVKFPSRNRGRESWSAESRMAEMTPWLARAAEPGLCDGLRRKASIWSRIVTLFALHGAGSSLDEAFALAGLAPAAAEAPPRPAIDGMPMVVPLTEAQSREAALAQLFVSAYAERNETARAEWHAVFDGSKGKWIQAMRSLAAVAGADAGQRAMEDGRKRWPSHPALADAVPGGSAD